MGSMTMLPNVFIVLLQTVVWSSDGVVCKCNMWYINNLFQCRNFFMLHGDVSLRGVFCVIIIIPVSWLNMSLTDLHLSWNNELLYCCRNFLTRSTGTVHTTAKACLTGVTIRISDLDRHQNLIICSLAHCWPSLKSSCKSLWKFLCKVANRHRQTTTVTWPPWRT